MERRDIKADYVAAYRKQFDDAVAAGKLGHARRVAHALQGLGVKVTVPQAAQTETTTAERQPAEDAKPTPAAETATEASTDSAEAKPAAKRAPSSRGKTAEK
jgi:hypothetical protein